MSLPDYDTLHTALQTVLSCTTWQLRNIDLCTYILELTNTVYRIAQKFDGKKL